MVLHFPPPTSKTMMTTAPLSTAFTSTSQLWLFRNQFWFLWLLLALGFSSFLRCTTVSAAEGLSTSRPNILLLITDDQDVLVGGIDHMDYLRTTFSQQAVVFDNAFVHTPICCPSRSSILTGNYLHNGNAINNSFSGNCYGQVWRNESELHTFAVFAQQLGYRTAFAGKYLNTYGYDRRRNDPPIVPPGWNRWHGLVGNSRYYNYTLIAHDDDDNNEAAPKRVRYNDTYETDYLPNVLASLTVKTMHEFATNTPDQPWLIVCSWPTPHAPFTSAPFDEHTFDKYAAIRTPNWNSTSNADKHWLMRRLASIDEETERHIDTIYRKRMESLQTIDRQVKLFVDTLTKLEQLDSTFIVYTSDNGYQLGQHRLENDKRHLYEYDLRVPMLVRTPLGVAKTIHAPVLNIDLAPTILDMAGMEPLDFMDGRSFLELLNNGSTAPWRRDFLISYHGEGDPACGMAECPPLPPEQYHGRDMPDSYNNTYNCVYELDSSVHSIYCKFQDDENFVEYYDLRADPWQTRNTESELSDERRFVLEARLVQLRNCHGPLCHVSGRDYASSL